MNILPEKLNEILARDVYKRKNHHKIKEALEYLDVKPSETFVEFYNKYAGQFGSENFGVTLLDLVDDKPTIAEYTFEAREAHDFTNNFLVLTEMCALAVYVLDADTDKVYFVDFEGGHELLLKGELEERYPTFYDFLVAYFYPRD